MNVLHVAAEAYPLVKTGGLADVAAALPPALVAAGADARLLLPGYPAVLAGLVDLETVGVVGPAFGAARVALLRGRMPDSGVVAYAIDAPYHYARPGGPYQDAAGVEWSDNLPRFALLGWIAAQLAGGALDPSWTPDIVHAHDWHAGLACAYVHAHPGTAAGTVFTIHNLAFQGRFPLAEFHRLGLPQPYATTATGLEYFETLSFMKAGLLLSDRLTTVSPTYAREITTPAFGSGLDGVIRGRGAALSGLLNGIDTAIWNPATDPAIPARYEPGRMTGKSACRRELQQMLGLAVDDQALLVCIVSRLSDQKGIDLVLKALPEMLQAGAQLAVQGTGDPVLEKGLLDAAAARPDRIAVRIAYDEPMAHRMVAGADAILVPSRFEPCGLTQLYGLRYGTLPIVRRVGGLADTVADAGDARDPVAGATGWLFDEAAPEALASAVHRAAARHADRPAWTAMVANAMARDNSWDGAAAGYLALYREARMARRLALGRS